MTSQPGSPKCRSAASSHGEIPEDAATRFVRNAGRLPSISVVVSVYNSQETLEELVQRLDVVLQQSAERSEIILVNDGSRDRSWQVAAALAGRYATIRGIDLIQNYGQHNALLAGIRATNSELICTIDDDLQHPPEEIPKLLARVLEGYDVVYGSSQAQQSPLWRRRASQLARLFFKRALSGTMSTKASGFRVFRASLRDTFHGYHLPFVSIDLLLMSATTCASSVEVMHYPRRRGSSGYSVRKLVMHALGIAIGLSVVQLRRRRARLVDRIGSMLSRIIRRPPYVIRATLTSAPGS